MQFGPFEPPEPSTESTHLSEQTDLQFRDTWLPSNCFQVQKQTHDLAQDLTSILEQGDRLRHLLQN